jgi:predicted adenine nucleotide alpha hydrolase (AANH) superfamily ATPase
MTVKTKAKKTPKAKRKEKHCTRCKNIHLESVAEKGKDETSHFFAKGKKLMTFSK